MLRPPAPGSLRSASSTPARRSRPAVGAAPAPRPVRQRGGGCVVLLVEDEPLARDVQREILQDAGFTVLDACSAEAALDVSAGFDGEIDVLVSDLTLPGLPGCELAARLLAARPGLGVVFTSGYGAERSPCARFAGSAFLQKPFSIEGLVAVVDAVAGVSAREVSQGARAGLLAEA